MCDSSLGHRIFLLTYIKFHPDIEIFIQYSNANVSLPNNILILEHWFGNL